MPLGGPLHTLDGDAFVTMPPSTFPSSGRARVKAILGQQPNKVTSEDLGRFENYLVGAGAYCSALTAADYQAHRLMMRRRG